jgi:vacuolar-type H+-ATPase subunit E/Vma4
VQNLKQELALKMAQVERALAKQKQCYAEMGRELPEVLTTAMDELKNAESDVAQQAETKERELVKAKQRRQEFQSSMQVIEQWLNEAEERLTGPIAPTPEEFAKHEVRFSILGSSKFLPRAID